MSDELDPNKSETKIVPAEVDAASVAAREAYEARVAASERLGKELFYIDASLRPHGLSIGNLLLSVAKHFHGVSIPTFQPDAVDIATGITSKQ